MAIKTKMNHCPRCKAKIDAVSSLSVEDHKPNAGDLTVCAYCCEILEFDASLNIIALQSDTLDKLDQSELDQIFHIRNSLIDYNANGEGFK